MVDRIELTPQGFYPVCPVCTNAILPHQGVEMHEALLTRGMVIREHQHLIMVKYNCVNLHLVCHPMARSKLAQKDIIRYLIAWETSAGILSWLLEIKSTITSSEIDSLERIVKDEMH